MIYDGLRDWLIKVDELGELRTLEDVDWNLEMGAIVDVLYREHPPYPPALIFDKIKGHANGYRALFGHFASPKRIALTLGITEEFDHLLEFTRMYHERMRRSAPVPTKEVRSGADRSMSTLRKGMRSTFGAFRRRCFTKKTAAAIWARATW